MQFSNMETRFKYCFTGDLPEKDDEQKNVTVFCWYNTASDATDGLYSVRSKSILIVEIGIWKVILLGRISKYLLEANKQLYSFGMVQQRYLMKMGMNGEDDYILSQQETKPNAGQNNSNHQENFLINERSDMVVVLNLLIRLA